MEHLLPIEIENGLHQAGRFNLHCLICIGRADIMITLWMLGFFICRVCRISFGGRDTALLISWVVKILRIAQLDCFKEISGILAAKYIGYAE